MEPSPDAGPLASGTSHRFGLGLTGRNEEETEKIKQKGNGIHLLYLSLGCDAFI